MAASVVSVLPQSEVIEINKRPLRDFANELSRDVETTKVDLSGPFLVELTGKLDDGGKLDVSSSSFARIEGDPALVERVKRGILAISDAGYFQYLKSLDAKEFTLVVEQSATDLSAKIVAVQPTEQRAKTVASAMTLLLQVSRAQLEREGATEDQKRDAVILKFMTAWADASTVIFSFKVAKAEMHRMIAEKLAEQAKSGQ